MRIGKIALCVLSVTGMGASLTGCALLTGGQPNQVASQQAEVTKNDELIAIDLVNALVQFEGMHPSNTQLSLTKSNTGFSMALHSVLSAAGYSIDNSQSGRVVSSYVEQGKQEITGKHQTYMVAAGDIKIKRDYFLQPWGVTPSSNLYVQGADASQIILNDDLFDQAAPQIAAAPAMPTIKPQPVVQASAQPVVATPDVVTTAIPTVAKPTLMPLVTPMPSRDALVDQARADKQNMYEIGGSNFGQVFDEFYDVRKMSVVFANDSMRLGRSGKAKINQLLTTFNQDTDVVSVVGCSHGRTSLQDGNKRLAIGRAERVAEALLYAGVPQNKVLEEGCWASKPFDEVFPRRGVVLTIKREKRNG